MNKKTAPTDIATIRQSDFFLHESSDGYIRVEVRLENDNVWLTQAGMADLYQTSKQNVSLHLQNIFREGELNPEATVKKYLTVQKEGNRQVKRSVDHYSLDAILAVGYRVKSAVGTRFRQWATARLGEYIVKGFTMDDERLKNPAGLTDYFDELLERIREIRASEARVYQQIREIFSMAVDYRDGEQETQLFFAAMQNKMHFAATGLTAAEIVRKRADALQPNMGLTSWKSGRVLKRDVTTAKNYLNAAEIDMLNRITVMFLDQAEFRARRRQNIHMADWEDTLDAFLSSNELPLLAGTGQISHEKAEQFALEQYDEFAKRRRLQSEDEAEARYIEDLRQSAETVARKRGKK